MGMFLDFIKHNFVYIAFIIILLVLALVGYIIDTSKTNKLKRELTGKNDEDVNIDIPLMDAKLNETISMKPVNEEVAIDAKEEPVINDEYKNEFAPEGDEMSYFVMDDEDKEKLEEEMPNFTVPEDSNDSFEPPML